MTDQSVQALLTLIEEHQAAECQRLLAEARAQAADMVKHAYHEALRRMHQAIVDERQRARREISSADAHLSTVRRQRAQRHARAILNEARGLLRLALEVRWADPSTRAAWVDGLIADALRALPEGPRRIAHPPDWPAEERQRVAERLQTAGRPAPEWVQDSSLQAGLRLCAGGACVDGSLGGLLADADGIDGELLALAGDVMQPPEAQGHGG
jgi:hypothetical protein